MKTILIFATSLVLCINASAQTLDVIAQRINRPMATSELLATRAQLERLSAAPPANWLIGYYLAYADVELSFRVENVNQKVQYIHEAQTCLAQIEDGDLSETETLLGYSYFALMAIDPRTNGPKYAAHIIACYEKALKANPGNPRAVFLNAIFRNNMAQATGSRYKEFETDIARSKELFALQDTTSVKPYWRAHFLEAGLVDHP
jgi:hypothetical protein